MARINIEDSLYTDHRFMELCIRLQSVDASLGALVRAWTVAQKYFLKDDRKIPRDVWDSQRLSNHIIEVGLAVEENGRIHIIGAEDQFSWLLQRVEAGKKGGQATAKRPLSDRLATGKPLPLSLPPTILKNSSSVNAVTKFHASMNPDSEAEILRRQWKEVFGKKFYFLNHSLDKVLDRFNAPKEFQEFCNDVINSRSGSKVSDSEALVYVTGAIKKELGIK